MLHDVYGIVKRTMVGYKGGHVEKDVLKQLNIPSLNLETVGCSKYDVLKYQPPPPPPFNYCFPVAVFMQMIAWIIV